MPAQQTGSNVIVGYKAQSALGTPASGAGGLGLRIRKGSPGMRLIKAVVESQEVRRDGQSTRGRHGSRRTEGSFAVELCQGELDTLIEAVMRGTWVAQTDLTQATGSLTSITTTTSTIVNGGGSWLTQGVRRGDMVKLTGHQTAANNGKWFRVTGVTASTITVAGTPLTADAVADTSFTLSIAKTIIQANPPTERYFTIDQYLADLDISDLFTDVKVCRLEISAQPNQPVVATLTLMGLDGDPQTTGSSPVLTSPTYTTTLPLVMADGTIRINGTDYGTITGFTLVLDAGGQVPEVLANNAPDVFLNNAKLSGQITCLKNASTFRSAFDAETQIEIFVHCEDDTQSDPKPFVSFYVGNAVFDGDDAPLGNDGAMVETIPWRAGKDEAGSDHAATMLKISTG